MSWFEPFPLSIYQEENEITGKNPPEVCPTEPFVAGVNVRCGPLLRLFGTHEGNQDNYRGLILLVVDETEPMPEVTFDVGPLVGEGEPQLELGEFVGTKIAVELGLVFYRYLIDLKLATYEQLVKYAVNGVHVLLYLFFVPALAMLMNVVLYLCNGMSLGTDTKDFKLSLWLDVLNKHADLHYHVMLGGGDQLYCDGIKLALPLVKQWAELSRYSRKRHVKVTPELDLEVDNYYLKTYTNWFGKGFLKVKAGTLVLSAFPRALLMIPSVNIYDDHDIIDGYGSYKDKTMRGDLFELLGAKAYKYYMLFQHHVSLDEPLYGKAEPLWILGGVGPYIKQPNHLIYMNLGKEIALLGLDCRTERKLDQICLRQTYGVVFDRLEREILNNPNIKHLLVMLGVPIFYPRLVWLEKLLSLTALAPARMMAQRNLINKGLVNEFDGEVEVLDDLNDHWCAADHKAERNKLTKLLIEFGAAKGVRVTILLGDVHLAALGRVKLKFHKHPTMHRVVENKDVVVENANVLETPENDPRLIFNVISLAIINGPPPDGMATLLQKRLRIHTFDKNTQEDCVPLFFCDVNAKDRDNNRFLNKRNWLDLILAKQLPLAAECSETNPVRRFPQPILPGYQDQVELALAHQKVSAEWVKYPLYPDSLVTRFRVERDANNFSAATTSYELYVPPLFGQWKLEKAPVKHVDK